uniref:Uncharacterized protein n=1 Tax=Arundo donax TaxID=35708 RepID=A0A0A8YDN6_ARUDO
MLMQLHNSFLWLQNSARSLILTNGMILGSALCNLVQLFFVFSSPFGSQSSSFSCSCLVDRKHL